MAGLEGQASTAACIGKSLCRLVDSGRNSQHLLVKVWEVEQARIHWCSEERIHQSYRLHFRNKIKTFLKLENKL
jgi:hypothetical protein